MSLVISSVGRREASPVSGPWGRALRVVQLLLLSLLGDCGALAAARLDFEETVWSFGTQTNSSELIHEFVFSNRGDENLVIRKVESGCDSCLQAHVKAIVVPPGQPGAVSCRLDTRKAIGDVRRSITVYSNDPRNPRTILELGGVIRPAYRVSPDNPGLGSEHGSNEVVVQVKPLVDLRRPLSRIECDGSLLLGSVTNTGEGGFMVYLRLDGMPPKLRRKMLAKVTSDDRQDPALYISVDIANPPEIEVVPSIVEMSGDGRREERILWVRQHGASPMTLKDVVATPRFIRCEIERIPNRADYRIYVSMGKNSQGIGPESALRLLMQDTAGNHHELSIPVRLSENGEDIEPSK